MRDVAKWTFASVAALLGAAAACQWTRVRCALCREQGLALQSTPRLEYAYVPGSDAEADLPAVRASRELALTRLEAFFGRKAPGPLRVYLFPSAEAAAPQRVGTAWPEGLEAFVVYGPGRWAYEKHNPGHELTHLFTNNAPDWSHPVGVVALLDEGLAEYLSGCSVDRHTALTQFELSSGRSRRPLALSPRVLEYHWQGLYPTAGSFVRFLVENQPDGRRKVLELLARTGRAAGEKQVQWGEFVAATEQSFAKPLPELEREWNEVLGAHWDAPFPLEEARPALAAAIGAAGLRAPWQVTYLDFQRYPSVVATDGSRRLTLCALPDDTWRVKAAELPNAGEPSE